MTRRVVVIGIGNPYRRDDGVASRVLEQLRRVEPAANCVELDGDPARLIELWDGAELAVVVDACRSGAAAGTVHHVELTGAALPAPPGVVSGHGIGLGEAIGLARALHRLPDRLWLVAVEVEDLGAGTELSPSVSAAVPTAVRTVLAALGRETDDLAP